MLNGQDFNDKEKADEIAAVGKLVDEHDGKNQKIFGDRDVHKDGLEGLDSELRALKPDLSSQGDFDAISGKIEKLDEQILKSLEEAKLLGVGLAENVNADDLSEKYRNKKRLHDEGTDLGKDRAERIGQMKS